MLRKSLAVVLTFGIALFAGPSFARPGHGDHGHRGKHSREYRHHGGYEGRHYRKHVVHHRVHRPHHVVRHRGAYYGAPYRPFYGRGPVFRVPYRYGYGYPYAYGRHHHHHDDDDDDVFLWLGLAAVGATALYALSQSSRTLHDQAYWGATTAPLGQPVTWNDRSASGSWTAVREGYAESGEYCREFQQEVRIGGRAESAYGTACWRPDGSWEVAP
jgi:hypothetical protein